MTSSASQQTPPSPPSAPSREDVAPHAAAELVCKVASASSSPALLRQPIQLVSTENREAAERLQAQYRDRLD